MVPYYEHEEHITCPSSRCKCGRTGCGTNVILDYSNAPRFEPKPRVKSFKSYEKFITSKVVRRKKWASLSL